MQAKLTKAELKLEIARALGITHKESRALLDIILDSMVRALRNGERIEIRGFGTFSTHVRKARQGRNPRTGDRVAVPARRVPHFKQSLELEALINGLVKREAKQASSTYPA